jgi:hypothetical protein
VVGFTSLDLSKPGKVYSCRVKFNRLQNVSYIGIASLATVTSNNYFDKAWNNSGHGHYVMTSFGRIYSHSDSTINNIYDGFRFE